MLVISVFLVFVEIFKRPQPYYLLRKNTAMFNSGQSAGTDSYDRIKTDKLTIIALNVSTTYVTL